MASQRASRALRGTAPIRCGNGRRGFARAVLSNETQWHRQALTRTAEARLGWPLTREGTVARRTAVASHRRATARQDIERPSDGAARNCSAMAQHSQDCPTRRRLCNQWLRQCMDGAARRHAWAWSAKQGRGYAAHGLQWLCRASQCCGLAKMALQRQGKAMRTSARATQGSALPRFA